MGTQSHKVVKKMEKCSIGVEVMRELMVDKKWIKRIKRHSCIEANLAKQRVWSKAGKVIGCKFIGSD